MAALLSLLVASVTAQTGEQLCNEATNACASATSCSDAATLATKKEKCAQAADAFYECPGWYHLLTVDYSCLLNPVPPAQHATIITMSIWINAPRTWPQLTQRSPVLIALATRLWSGLATVKLIWSL